MIKLPVLPWKLIPRSSRGERSWRTVRRDKRVKRDVHNEQNRSVIVIFINDDSPIIINCKQFIVSALSVARLRALRVPLRIYTARVKLKISSRSFFPILWLTLPLFPLTLRSSNHAIRYFSILSVEGKITVDFVGRFKKEGRGEKSKKVFTHLRHHRSPYRKHPVARPRS